MTSRTHCRACCLAALLIPFTPSIAPAQPSASPSQWRWYALCDNATTLDLDVSLDGSSLFRTNIPICQTETQDRRILKFKFTAPRPILWTGYRDDDVTTASRLSIEGDIWLAGGEQSGLILGVTFDDGKALLMNTLHFADAATASSTEIAKGLVVRTSPKQKIPAAIP